MGRYGDPKSWLVTQDEHSDAELEDSLDAVDDAEPVGQLSQIQYEDISDAEDAPAQAHVQYENIPDANGAPNAQVDWVIFEFDNDWPWDTFAEGQSTTYLVNRPDEPLQTYTLWRTLRQNHNESEFFLFSQLGGLLRKN